MASELIPGEVPVLRTCKPDGTSHGGFRWPLTVGAIVEAPDWNPKPTCGGGLHGLLRGEGNGSLLDWTEHAAWMVVAVAEVVDLVGKVKFPRCRVLHAGDRASATSLLDRLAPGAAIVGVSRIGGYRSTLTGGDYSTLTGGDYSTLTGGYRSTLTGGYGSTLTGGYRSTLTGGGGSTLSCQWWAGNRMRIAVAYVGEDGIKPDVAYRVEDGKFVEVRDGE